MKKLAISFALAGAVLSLAGTAHAGCYATVGISPLVQPGHPVGRPWVVTIRVLQHGLTPLAGARPAVRIRGTTGKLHVFRARAAGRDGTYRARVVFPGPGRYTVAVFDGFPVKACARVQTFRPVVIEAV